MSEILLKSDRCNNRAKVTGKEGRLRNLFLTLLAALIICCTEAYGQDQAIVVTGKVTDTNGESLPGVSVKIKNSNVSTSTDINGTYRITAPGSKSVVVFTYIGFGTMERAVGTNGTVNVEMKESQSQLDEVVVVGYSSMRRGDLTGSVATVRGEDLIGNNPISVNQGLQGMVAGVEVNRNDGAPGAGISMTIRGTNSFSGGEPLYVVDEIPVTSAGISGDAGNSADDAKQTINPLAFLNPNDIESIDILKDASETAQYGSRGANGVVLITTKKGRVGKDKVEIAVNTGISSISNPLELMNAYEYAVRANEARANFSKYDGGTLGPSWPGKVQLDEATNIVTYKPKPEDFITGVPAGSLTYPEGFKGTDWLGTILRNGLSQDYTLRLSGGTEKGTHSLSGNYVNQQGIIKRSGYKRYGTQLNISRKVSKFFELGVNTNISYANYQLVKTNTVQTQSNVMNDAMRYAPTHVFDDPYSHLREETAAASRISNPYKSVMHMKDETGSVRIYTAGFAQLNFTPSLNLRQRFGYNYNSNERQNYYSRDVHQGRPPINGRASEGEEANRQLTLESLLSYNKRFGNDHNISAVGVFSYENANRRRYEIRATGFPTDINENFNIGAGLVQQTPQNRMEENALMSFLGRVHYGYKGKYFFTGNFRRDGSSKFAKGNKWSDFSSAGVAWTVSEEEFIKDLNLFSHLKFRTSYGSTGNQGINPYATRYQMISVNAPIVDKVESGFALNKNNMVDLNLRWETTYQADIGLDMGFMNDRLSVTADLYRKRTKSLLQTKSLAPSTGFDTKSTNFGTVINEGLELSIYGAVIQKQRFNWKVNGNIAFNRNEIADLEGDQFLRLYTGMESAMVLRNGQPIGSIWGMVEDGFYDNEAEVRADPRWKTLPDDRLKSKIGEIKYVNIDGDPEGVISASNDRTIIGTTVPDYTFGLTNTFGYKNLTFSFFIQGSIGNDLLNTNSLSIRMGERDNFPKFAYDGRWTEETAATATWPRLDAGSGREMFFSDRNVEDGSFVRLKTINVGYTFNAKRFFASTIYLYGSVNNILTFTNYSWYDPDVNSFASDAARRGVDMNAYPNSRTFNLGVRASF